MKEKKKPYYYDLKRYETIRFNHSVEFIKAFRIYNSKCPKIRKMFAKLKMKFLSEMYGIEISPDVKIGKGLYIGHGYNITINPQTIIGENVNIHKGVTIGQENRGTRKGAPTIGNFVWCGVNSTIVGNIKIGNNVLIAPNTYVNGDVPDNCIVLGNPHKVFPNEKATEGYINHTV